MSIITELQEHKISIDRPVYNDNLLKEKYLYNDEFKLKEENILHNTKNYFVKHYKPNKTCMHNFLLDRFPIAKWIAKYDIKHDILKDLIAGLTVGVIQIAPTMANSMMANLPPINGLYVAFFAVMTYFLLGTCRHLSLGTHGVISLMIGKTIEKYAGVLYEDTMHVVYAHDSNGSELHLNDNSSYLSSDPEEAKVMIATSLCFLAGIIHILLSVLNGGVFTKYFSNNVLNSFTISSSIIIVVSQIETLLGITIKIENIPFELVDNIIGIAKQIHNTNVATLIVSFLSITALYCVKHFINEKYKKRLITPVPIELIVVIIATTFSYFFRFNQKYDISVVGKIPLGMPHPRFPPIGSVFFMLIGDAFNIAIVSFALNISLVKYFSNKHDYEINSNQELLSYGIGNLACSFFSGFPACSGLTRSLIVEGIGARTQVYSFISSLIVLAAFLGIGFLFQELPTSVLASIIVVSLLHKCFEAKSIVFIFKKSKIEACAWIATFCGVVILDIDYGLYIGLSCSLLLVIFQTQRPPASVIGNIMNTEFYEDINYCSEAKEIRGIKIIRYEANIYYANVENFMYQIIKLSSVGPRELIALIEKKKEETNKLIKKLKSKKIRKIEQINEAEACIRIGEEEQAKKNLEIEIDSILNTIHIKEIIIDLSSINFIDSMGTEAILRLAQMFKKLGIQLHLTHIKANIFRYMKRYSFNDKFDFQYVYPSNHDAVCFILSNSEATNNYVCDSITIDIKQ